MFQKYGKWKKIKEIITFLVCLRSDLSPVSSKSIPVKKERWQVLSGGGGGGWGGVLLLCNMSSFPPKRTVQAVWAHGV